MMRIPCSHKIVPGCLFVLLIGFSAQAQDFSKDYKPLRDYKPSTTVTQSIVSAYEESIATINVQAKSSAETKKIKKDIKEAITGLSDNFLCLDTYNLVMKRDTITRYLEQLVKRVQKYNPLMAGTDYRIFTYRNPVPNASNWAQGLILVNLDLLVRMESEADLVFVLCHELAHDVKKHVMNGIQARIKLFYDPEFQKKIKAAKRTAYNTVKTTETLLIQFLARSAEHTRENELEADSLALIFMVNAGYSPADASAALMKLDGFDEPFYSDKIDFARHFSFPDYPFKGEWLEGNDTEDLGGNMEELREIPDSLKTHPDCDLRAEALEKIIQKEAYKPGSGKTTGNYDYFRSLAAFETIEFLLAEEEYGYALYLTLHMLKKYPENKYLHCATSLCLFEIYAAQKKHRFSKVVALQNKTYSEAYNEYLTLMHTLSSSETKEIATRYYTQYVEGQKKDPFAGYVGAIAASLDKPKTEYPDLVMAYEKNFKDAYYKELLDKKLNSNPIKK